MEYPLCARPSDAECFLLTNGLGGYCSVTTAFSIPRADQGILVAAATAPNRRITLAHRLQEKLCFPGETVYLSTQTFADGTKPEEGYRLIKGFSAAPTPRWELEARGVRVLRRCAMAWERNSVAVIYDIENPTALPCRLEITPYWKMAPKETALEAPFALKWENGRVLGNGWESHISTNAAILPLDPHWQLLSYPEDEKDGRPDRGLAGACCAAVLEIAPRASARMTLRISLEEEQAEAEEILANQEQRLARVQALCPLTHPIARTLALAADAFIARRDSTGGKTILAGYPLFSDWGRDTMIALPGCTLATGRPEDAKSILRTFLTYEHRGLVPTSSPRGIWNRCITP